jgi:hypothetical protein
VLRDCLARRAHLMFHREARTDFKEGLAVSCGELIEDCPPGRVRQGFEDITQTVQIIGKWLLACQPPPLSAPHRTDLDVPPARRFAVPQEGANGAAALIYLMGGSVV